VYQQTNKGACAARNLAFLKSTGDYIQYLDADDLLSPNKIEDQLKFLRKKPQSITSCIWGRFYNRLVDVRWEQQDINKYYPKPIEWLVDSWNGLGITAQHCWLIPRQLIDKAGLWNDALKINQDGEFFSRVLIQASAIQFCADAKVYYRSGNIGSVSQNNKSKAKAESLLLSYQLYKNNVREHLDNIKLKKALGNNFLNFIYQYHITFPDLCKEAENEFQQLEVGQMWPVGVRRFKQLANVIGFKYALTIKKTLNIK
jgi:glycosyltransferase involved in cell wall biosynthesis